MICVVATGDHTMSLNFTEDFFRTLSLQNYTNFKVFIVDDNFPGNFSYRTMAMVALKYPNLKKKITMIQNAKSIGIIASLDSTIK